MVAIDRYLAERPKPREGDINLAGIATTVGYALGLWWALGGPMWAGITSIVLDEADGRIARATGTTTETGAALDWGADVALVPLCLLRLGQAVGHEALALSTAPAVLYVQSELKAKNQAPPVLSARAAIMIAAMLAEAK